MPCRTNRQHPAAENPAGLRRRIIPVDRRGRRGKNGSAPPPGNHRPRCTRSHDDETHASPALEMAQPQSLLQLFGVTLDDPAVLGQAHENLDFRIERQGRELVLRGFSFALRPLDEQPLFRTRLSAVFVPMRWTDAQQGKPRTERTFHALPPSDVFPSPLRQSLSQGEDGNRPMIPIPPQALSVIVRKSGSLPAASTQNATSSVNLCWTFRALYTPTQCP